MKKYYDLADKFKGVILDAERYLWNNPEPGYREFKTNAYVKEHFEKLGYKLVEAENTTGFYTVIDTGKPGPTVLVLAELDSLINRTHPDCDKQTGAVHSCGHHTQCASIIGLAYALKEKGALDGLSGKIKICLVPAEEGIEIGYRKDLVKKGIIKYTSGKPEFISRRFFDDVDLAFMVHSSPRENVKFVLTKGHNGVIRKRTTVIGKSAHAGAHPNEGINALNAASLIILAVNSLRETFEEKHYARVHSIITKGGDAVNAVPDEVIIESYVRAAEPIAHKKVNDAVNRAISAAAVAIGCSVKIEDMAGSEALREDENLRELAFTVFEEIAGKDGYKYESDWLASSTDMGDISTLVPSIHAYATGAKGTSHGVDYRIENPYDACVNATKFEIGLIRKLLENDAKNAKEIMAKFTPTFKSVDEYLAHKASLNMDKETVKYNQDGTITIDYKV
ncbi:MAG: amidohydrolase [Clostridiales bacterium]|nr:amidohydrolase [Clostridiales bacterium]